MESGIVFGCEDELVKMTPEPLVYEELIALNRDWHRLETRKILMPDEIPIHPYVFNSDFVYTPKFIEEVRKNLPESIEQDISEIERILGIDLGLKVTPTGICEKEHEYECGFRLFRSGVYPDREYLTLGIGATSIAMEKKQGNLRRSMKLPKSQRRHPMNLDKLKQYSSNDRIAIWHTHNIHDGNMPWQLYLRNFAIVFNNLGLERLESETPGHKQRERMSE